MPLSTRGCRYLVPAGGSSSLCPTEVSDERPPVHQISDLRLRIAGLRSGAKLLEHARNECPRMCNTSAQVGGAVLSLLAFFGALAVKFLSARSITEPAAREAGVAAKR